MFGMVPAGLWGVNAGLDGAGVDTYNGPALTCPQRLWEAAENASLKEELAMAEEEKGKVEKAAEKSGEIVGKGLKKGFGAVKSFGKSAKDAATKKEEE